MFRSSISLTMKPEKLKTSSSFSSFPLTYLSFWLVFGTDLARVDLESTRIRPSRVDLNFWSNILHKSTRVESTWSNFLSLKPSRLEKSSRFQSLFLASSHFNDAKMRKSPLEWRRDALRDAKKSKSGKIFISLIAFFFGFPFFSLSVEEKASEESSFVASRWIVSRLRDAGKDTERDASQHFHTCKVLTLFLTKVSTSLWNWSLNKERKTEKFDR